MKFNFAPDHAASNTLSQYRAIRRMARVWVSEWHDRDRYSAYGSALSRLAYDGRRAFNRIRRPHGSRIVIGPITTRRRRRVALN